MEAPDNSDRGLIVVIATSRHSSIPRGLTGKTTANELSSAIMNPIRAACIKSFWNGLAGCDLTPSLNALACRKQAATPLPLRSLRSRF
jgi:hypothetical protein